MHGTVGKLREVRLKWHLDFVILRDLFQKFCNAARIFDLQGFELW